MTLSDRERDLTMALIDHDLALQERRRLRHRKKYRKLRMWPDESDIFKATRERIALLFEDPDAYHERYPQA